MSRYLRLLGEKRRHLKRIGLLCGCLFLCLWGLPHLIGLTCNNLGSLAINQMLFATSPADHTLHFQHAQGYLQHGLRWSWAPREVRAQLYTNLAFLYLDAQRVDEAKQALQQAATLDPDHRQAQFQLGQILADQGEEGAALAAWRTANAAQYFLRQGRILASDGQLEAAVRQYEIALNIQPDLYEGYELLGRTLRRLGLKEEALNALTSAVELTPPTSAHRYLLQAEIHLAHEEWRAAADAYQRAAALDPWDATSLYRSGSLRMEKLQDVSGAIADYERAVSRDPQHVAARLALGELYHARRACTDVGYWLAPLLTEDIDPKIAAQAHALVGTCLLSRADSSGLWYLEQAVALQPQMVDYRLAWADGHRQFGANQQALTLYQEILEMAPDNAAAQLAIQELGDDAP